MATREEIQAHGMKIKRLPIIDHTDVDAVRKRITDYLRMCEEDGILPTLSGVGEAIGVHRTTVKRWITGEVSVSPDIRALVIEAENHIAFLMEQDIIEGKTNPVGKIFVMKNNFEDYSETSRIEVKAEERHYSEKELLAMADKLPGFKARREALEDKHES